MTAIPRYRPLAGPAILSAGFRPFFLLAALWAALAVPVWLMMFAGVAPVLPALPPQVWHAHEMVYGYGAAVVAGFLLTSIPNWTGQLPLQGGPLLFLVLLWISGRVGLLASARIGAAGAAAWHFRCCSWPSSHAKSSPGGTGAICRCSPRSPHCCWATCWSTSTRSA